ncbi:MAG TPA: hypothetical protein VNW92_03570 [Polyangiaceae bacterium]|jgi:hypothetical protein|nr:hypothetical protein [Polyangiaceae bacterium]
MNPNEAAEESFDDHFFRAGDDSSDVSAPQSLAAVALGEDLPRVVDAAWLARRARLTRLVGWTVSALAVFALLAPFAHTPRTRRAADGAAVVSVAAVRAPFSSSVAELTPPAEQSPTSASAPVLATVREPVHSRPSKVIKPKPAAATPSSGTVTWPVPGRATPSEPPVGRFPDPL